jgi:hypothetical protein
MPEQWLADGGARRIGLGCHNHCYRYGPVKAGQFHIN